MASVEEMIRRDVADDVSLKVHAFTIDAVRKGFIAKRNILRVSGHVTSEHDREKLLGIVNHHVGDAYTVEFNVTVKQPAGA
jgi:hypothetical protein